MWNELQVDRPDRVDPDPLGKFFFCSICFTTSRRGSTGRWKRSRCQTFQKSEMWETKQKSSKCSTQNLQKYLQKKIVWKQNLWRINWCFIYHLRRSSNFLGAEEVVTSRILQIQWCLVKTNWPNMPRQWERQASENWEPCEAPWVFVATLCSAFNRDKGPVLMTAHHDLNSRILWSFCLLTGKPWTWRLSSTFFAQPDSLEKKWWKKIKCPIFSDVFFWGEVFFPEVFLFCVRGTRDRAISSANSCMLPWWQCTPSAIFLDRQLSTRHAGEHIVNLGIYLLQNFRIKLDKPSWNTPL